MSFDRVPEDFMKGVFLAPHNFSDPENPEHGEYVHLQLRNDLYFSTLDQISRVEFSTFNFMGGEEWIKVESMKPCSVKKEWFWNLSNARKKSTGRTLRQTPDLQVDMIGCQQWQVAYHQGSNEAVRSKYRVETLQTNTDIFKTQIYPPTIYKTLKDLLMN